MTIWRVIPGWERYEISDDGRCRRTETKEELDGGLSSQGYWKYKLSRDGGRPEDLNAHVLMATAFYGPKPDGAMTVHLNGDKTDDRLGNIRYQINDTRKAQLAFQRLMAAEKRRRSA